MALPRINMTPVKVPRCAADWPEKWQAAARRALRAELTDADGAKDILKRNISADALIEQVWNAIVRESGHDNIMK